MFAPRLLVDNDALLKAAHWNILSCVPSLLAVDWEQVAVLPQFPPRVTRAERKLFASPDVAHSLALNLRRCTALPPPDPGTVAMLQGRPRIDVGEVLLLGALATSPDYTLLTGDKKALQALSDPELAPILNTFSGRILCVEQLLWHALETLGADALIERIRYWTPRDQTALAIFGRTDTKSAEQIREGLRSYVRWLDAQVPGLLMRGFGNQALKFDS